MRKVHHVPNKGRLCSVQDCGRPCHSRGFCHAHYQRHRKGMDLTPPVLSKRRAPLAERLWSRVERTDGCWLWQGTIDRHGYGQISRGGRGTGQAFVHRAAYELLVGPIPEGLVLDHLCRTPLCVRPDHLEPVTLEENKDRGNDITRRNRRKTHCIRGHEFTLENTIRSKGGGRRCRECKREYDRAQYRARRVA